MMAGMGDVDGNCDDVGGGGAGVQVLAPRDVLRVVLVVAAMLLDQNLLGMQEGSAACAGPACMSQLRSLHLLCPSVCVCLLASVGISVRGQQGSALLCVPCRRVEQRCKALKAPGLWSRSGFAVSPCLARTTAGKVQRSQRPATDKSQGSRAEAKRAVGSISGQRVLRAFCSSAHGGWGRAGHVSERVASFRRRFTSSSCSRRRVSRKAFGALLQSQAWPGASASQDLRKWGTRPGPQAAVEATLKAKSLSSWSASSYHEPSLAGRWISQGLRVCRFGFGRLQGHVPWCRA